MMFQEREGGQQSSERNEAVEGPGSIKGFDLPYGKAKNNDTH